MGTVAGSVFQVQPWPELGRRLGARWYGPKMWHSMTHLEFSQFGLVTGGERKRQKVPVPLLDLSPPPASNLGGSNLLPLLSPR